MSLVLVFRPRQQGLQDRGLGLWGRPHTVSKRQCCLDPGHPQCFEQPHTKGFLTLFPRRGYQDPQETRHVQSLNSGLPLPKTCSFVWGSETPTFQILRHSYLLADSQGAVPTGYATTRAMLGPAWVIGTRAFSTGGRTTQRSPASRSAGTAGRGGSGSGCVRARSLLSALPPLCGTYVSTL